MSNATAHRDAPQPRETDAPAKGASTELEQNIHNDAYSPGKDETTKITDSTRDGTKSSDSTKNDDGTKTNDGTKTGDGSKTNDSTSTKDGAEKIGVMSDTERQARSFIGQTLLCTPSEKGLESQTIGMNGSEFTYRPGERPDRLEKATQSKIDGVERISKEYNGRSDGLLSDEATSSSGSRSLERRFEPGKGPNGLTFDRMDKFQNLENYKAEYDSSRNPDGIKSHTESKTCSMNRESTSYEGRPDGLKSFTRTREGDSEKSLSEYEEGKGKDGLLREQRWKSANDRGYDRSYDPAKNPDGLASETYSKHGDREERSRSFKGREDGLVSEKDVADARVGKISQKTYENGTVVSTYPEGKTGSFEAAQITHEPGRAPVYSDAENKRTFTTGVDKAVPVATSFDTDGAVTQKMSDGQDAKSNLPDYVKGADARELGKYTTQLEQATADPNSTTARAGVDGLFKAAHSRVPEDASSAKEVLGRVAQQDGDAGARVREQAANQLDSTNPRHRNLGADLLASSARQWSGQDVSNMSKHPSVELAAKLGNVPPADLEPHKAALLEGLKSTAASQPGDAEFSSERRNGAIAMTAALGGEEALRAAGLQVADGDNSSVRTADGTTLKFDKGEDKSLRLRSIESPGKGVDGDTEAQSLDASTGKVQSVDKKDRYGSYQESRFNSTEFGTISQRKYDSETVRTLIPGNNGASGQPSEIVHQKGKPAEIIDGQGQKTEAAGSQPIKVATSFDEAGKATQIKSDGTTEVASMEDYVKNSDTAELSQQIDNFEKLAQSGPEASRSGSIDGLVKVATADGGDAAERAKTTLGRLSGDEATRAMIVQSELQATNQGKPLSETPAGDATPPTGRDKAVMLVASTTGYEGLKQAGMQVDEAAGTATTGDGSTYRFDKDSAGRLRPSSVENADGTRKTEFEYGKDGALSGTLEHKMEADVRTYDNVQLPALQNGWGPYQALEQLRSEGKISMSNVEMKREAERIRDREFAKSGREHFNVGEQPMMYSSDEQKPPAESSVHRNAGGQVDRMTRADGTSIEINYEGGKPSRIKDGLGPDLVSKDGGETWSMDVPDAKPSAPQTEDKKVGAPNLEFKAKMNIDTENGTVSLRGEDGSRLNMKADGSRTVTTDDGKESVLFRPESRETKPGLTDAAPEETKAAPEVTREKPEATIDKPAKDSYPPAEVKYSGVQPTGYEPWRKNSKMEGGEYDGWGRKVMTTDDFFAGRSGFVSIAVDQNAHVKDGQLFYSPELDQKYASKMAEKYGQNWKEDGHHIWLRAMDSGGAFKGTWSGRNADSPTKVDIATGTDKMVGSKESQADSITGAKSKKDQISLHMVPESNQSRLDAIRTAPVKPGRNQAAREKSAYRDHGFRDEWRRGIRPGESESQKEKQDSSPDTNKEKPDSNKHKPDSNKDKPQSESTIVPAGKIAHGITGEYMPEKLTADMAEQHLRNAKEVAGNRRPKGDCGRGEREALNLSGFNLKGGPGQGRVATELGKYLESTGLFDKIPLKDAKGFKDGDILVRPWTEKRTAQKGGENKGDIGTVDRNGRLYNDGVSQVNLRSKLYDNSSSYILRFKQPGTESAPQEDRSVFRGAPADSSKHLGQREEGVAQRETSVPDESKKPRIGDEVKSPGIRDSFNILVLDSIKGQRTSDQARFRRPAELKDFWVVQPSGFECGPSALAMAISDKQQKPPFSAKEIHEISKETGTMKYGAFPHGKDESNMAESAKRYGLNAETHNFEKDDPKMMKKLDSELAKGRGAIALIKNPDTGNGHFIYIAGKTDDNHYLVGNSGKSAYKDLKPVSRERLEGWMHGTNSTRKARNPYFASVW